MSLDINAFSPQARTWLQDELHVMTQHATNQYEAIQFHHALHACSRRLEPELLSQVLHTSFGVNVNPILTSSGSGSVTTTSDKPLLLDLLQRSSSSLGSDLLLSDGACLQSIPIHPEWRYRQAIPILLQAEAATLQSAATSTPATSSSPSMNKPAAVISDALSVVAATPASSEQQQQGTQPPHRLFILNFLDGVARKRTTASGSSSVESLLRNSFQRTPPNGNILGALLQLAQEMYLTPAAPGEEPVHPLLILSGLEIACIVLEQCIIVPEIGASSSSPAPLMLSTAQRGELGLKATELLLEWFLLSPTTTAAGEFPADVHRAWMRRIAQCFADSMQRSASLQAILSRRISTFLKTRGTTQTLLGLAYLCRNLAHQLKRNQVSDATDAQTDTHAWIKDFASDAHLQRMLALYDAV